MRDAVQYVATGTRLLAVGPRIIGGEPAPAGAFPWMASLELKLRRKDSHFCGGAFIAPQWVITAAHCVNANSAGAINVLGGTNTLETGGELHPVDRVIVHEQYSADTQENDVALLHLGKPFGGTPIRLLTGADAARLTAPGILAVSAGWGYTAEGGDVSNVLRNVTVQIVSNQTCNGLAAYAGAVTDKMLCAGFPEGGKDSCQGDSGGPLMVPDEQGGHFLAGVVSWGEGCGRPNKFGVYTRVATVADWVAGKIGTRITPVASNAAPSSSNAAGNSTQVAPAGVQSARSERFGSASPMPRLLQRQTEAPPLDSSPSQPTLLLTMPPPRPSALSQEQKTAPRLRAERRLGVPVDRKYSPTYPPRAQSRQTRDATPSAAQRQSSRGNYYVRDEGGRGYYVVPRDGGPRYYVPYERSRTVILPSFDWRLFR